ncbi:DUF1127 domain-containing protein [Roseomonas sp. KE2513]|uniref:DUF1127 domain-containing protein n=1 Tax=Roseomonas sp. KE2513 TaxID=2479202 RepID=UPI0018E01DFE|nr:DUF1127 domain-containing protein [Roseomonas sp. KE2513]MBI0539635.1 DUF1127 domain-containing protein [Roseomonas sp. KE2513]
MSASAASLTDRLLARAARLRPSTCPASLIPEGRWTRTLRWFADRRHLKEMDTRMLRDVGLTPEDVRRGVPFGVSNQRQAHSAGPGADPD